MQVAAAMRSWLDAWHRSMHNERVVGRCVVRMRRLLVSRCMSSWALEWEHGCAVRLAGERAFSSWLNREVSSGWRRWKESWSRKRRQEYIVSSCVGRWGHRTLSCALNGWCAHVDARRLCARSLRRLGAVCGMEVAAAMRTWTDAWLLCVRVEAMAWRREQPA